MAFSPEAPGGYSPQEDITNNPEGLENISNNEAAEQAEQNEQKAITPEEATDQANVLAKQADDLAKKHDRFVSLLDTKRVIKQYEAMGLVASKKTLDDLAAKAVITMGHLKTEATNAIRGWESQLDDLAAQGADVFDLNEAISDLAEISGVERTVKPVESIVEVPLEIAESTPEASNDNVEAFKNSLNGVADNLDTEKMLGRDVEAKRDKLEKTFADDIVGNVYDISNYTRSVDIIEGLVPVVKEAVEKFVSLRDSNDFNINSEKALDIRNRILAKIPGENLSADGFFENDPDSKKRADEALNKISKELLKIAA